MSGEALAAASSTAVTPRCLSLVVSSQNVRQPRDDVITLHLVFFVAKLLALVKVASKPVPLTVSIAVSDDSINLSLLVCVLWPVAETRKGMVLCKLGRGDKAARWGYKMCQAWW